MNFEINSNSNLETIFNYLKRDLLLNNNNQTININININNSKKKKKKTKLEIYDSFLFILPNEIFSKILTYLEYKDIISLSFINNHFYSLINSFNNLWRKLYYLKFKNNSKLNHFNFCTDKNQCCSNIKSINNSNNNYNKEELFENFKLKNEKSNISWKLKYLENKKLNKNWNQGKYSVSSLDTNIGGIFCLSQKSNMLVTGSFDRELKLWKLDKDQYDSNKFEINPIMNIKGHDGWIWSTHLKQLNNFHKIKCISSSQDGTIMITNIDKDQFNQLLNDKFLFNDSQSSSSSNDSFGASTNSNNNQFNNNYINFNHNYKPKSFNLKQYNNNNNQYIPQQQQISSEYPKKHLFNNNNNNNSNNKSFIDGTFLYGHKGTVWTTAIDKQLKFIYSGGGDSLIKQWDAERSCFVSDIGKHNESILCLSGVSNEHPNLLASGSADHSIRLWDIRQPPSSKMVLCINEHGVNIDCISLSNHFIVSGGDDGVIRVSDIRSMVTSPRPYVIAEIPAHDGSIRALSIKRNRMVTTSSDMSIKIWSIKNMDISVPKHCLLGHHGSVVSMQLKNNMIISGSLDSTVKIWNFSNN